MKMIGLGPRDFEGDWHLVRQITDYSGGPDGRLTGWACFRDAGDRRLRYEENGQLQMGASPIMAAKRTYIWQFEETQVDVRFVNSAPFHAFVPMGNVPGTDHTCGADLYTVRYDFRAWPQWQAVWRVQGPRKDYRSVSDYSK